NLALSDWMSVFEFVDQNPTMCQGKIVEHFKTKAEGALVFTQPTLSRKIKNRDSLVARVQSNPNALSSKRPRVVTRPDVEEALVSWMKDVDEGGQTWNRVMLREKRSEFEASFDVPESERITGEG
ncbi:hypothetical protein BJ138DRAFT_985022, partial [Hygrophoropsis aurantiaca]